MIAATEQSASRLCTACFDGAYPIELSSESVLGKNVIEHMLATAARGAVQTDPAIDEAALAEDALRRP